LLFVSIAETITVRSVPTAVLALRLAVFHGVLVTVGGVVVTAAGHDALKVRPQRLDRAELMSDLERSMTAPRIFALVFFLNFFKNILLFTLPKNSRWKK
jgi:hypothetical protein